MGDRVDETFHSEIGETLIDLWYSEIVRNIQKAVRQAEIPVTPVLPKVGHPLAGGGMSPAFSACLAAFLNICTKS